MPDPGWPIIFESGGPFWHAIYGETYRKSLKDLKEHFGPFWAFSRPVFTKKHRFLQILSKFINNSPVVGVGSFHPQNHQNGPETAKTGRKPEIKKLQISRLDSIQQGSIKETVKSSLPGAPDQTIKQTTRSGWVKRGGRGPQLRAKTWKSPRRRKVMRFNLWKVPKSGKHVILPSKNGPHPSPRPNRTFWSQFWA